MDRAEINKRAYADQERYGSIKEEDLMGRTLPTTQAGNAIGGGCSEASASRQPLRDQIRQELLDAEESARYFRLKSQQLRAALLTLEANPRIEEGLELIRTLGDAGIHLR